MLGEFGIDQPAAQLFEPRERASLILLHKPAIASYVGRENGHESPLYLLALEGATRERLLRSEAEYRTALREQHVLRAVRRPTVCDGAYCMGLNLGLDNREMLPPFMPVPA